jgi:hypothetical protein
MVVGNDTRRLLSSIGDIPPVELEQLYHGRQQAPTTNVGIN